MRPIALRLSPLLFLLLVGCATLGLAPAQTLNQKIAYAYGTHTAVLQATTGAVAAGKLSSADATQVLKLADDSRVLLDAATSLEASGDTAGATSKLALATTALTALQTFLNAHGGS